MKKPVFYSELAYVCGLLLLAFGTALTVVGGFGVSMVVAPAYILHLKVSQALPFFSFAMGEYVLQAIILLVMMLILRKGKLIYLLSFVTAVLYGFALTASQSIANFIPADSLVLRIVLYIVGVLICAAGVSLFFKTYIPPAAYEMFVKEISRKFNKPLSSFKVVYDCVSLAIALVMGLIFFGRFEGVGIGTVITAFVFGPMIRMFTVLFEKLFTFRDAFSLRGKFED